MKRCFQLGVSVFFLALLALSGMNCGSGCNDNEVEICPDFQTIGKNGEFFDDCTCIEPECDNDDDCADAFFCDQGFCVAD